MFCPNYVRTLSEILPTYVGISSELLSQNLLSFAEIFGHKSSQASSEVFFGHGTGKNSDTDKIWDGPKFGHGQDLGRTSVRTNFGQISDTDKISDGHGFGKISDRISDKISDTISDKSSNRISDEFRTGF